MAFVSREGPCSTDGFESKSVEPFRVAKQNSKISPGSVPWDNKLEYPEVEEGGDPAGEFIVEVVNFGLSSSSNNCEGESKSNEENCFHLIVKINYNFSNY